MLAQNNGYADVSGGTGVIVIALASIIIAEVFFKNISLGERLLTIVIGSVLYQLLLLGVIRIGLDTRYIRILSSGILAVFLMLPEIQKKLSQYSLIQREEQL